MSESTAQQIRLKPHGRDMIEAVAAYDGMTARLAEQAAFDVLMVGGGLLANFVYGLPDIGMVSLAEIISSADRVAATVSIPVVLDMDDAGPTAAHVRRTIELAERAQVAAVMMEDTDASTVKYLLSLERRCRQMGLQGRNTPSPRRSAGPARRGAGIAAVSGRSLSPCSDGCVASRPARRTRSSNRTRPRRYIEAGADFVFIPGMKGKDITTEVLDRTGGPLIYAEDEGVPRAERARLASIGVKVLYHWLVPFTTIFASYKAVLEDLRTDNLTVERPPLEINKELLRAADLSGWSKSARRPLGRERRGCPND